MKNNHEKDPLKTLFERHSSEVPKKSSQEWQGIHFKINEHNRKLKKTYWGISTLASAALIILFLLQPFRQETRQDLGTDQDLALFLFEEEESPTSVDLGEYGGYYLSLLSE